MKTVLLIGLGRFGRNIAMKLTELKHEVLAVDTNESRVNHALDFVTDAQIGDCTNREFLSQLGVRNFDACIVAIGDDFQSSLVVTDLLKELGAKKVIARASRGVQEKFLLRNGADEVVYPEKQLASWTAVRCISDSILDYVELDGENALVEVSVPAGWIGKTLIQLDVRKKFNLNILGEKRDRRLNLFVNPNKVLNGDATLLVLGKTKDLQKCFRL